jgi:hypothetical protein
MHVIDRKNDNENAQMKRIVITLSLLVLLTLGIAPEDGYAQTQCPNASEVQFPFDTSTWSLAQDFSVPSPRHQGRYHTGEDWFISGTESLGQPVRAIAAGRVTYSFALGWGRDGGVVIIEHVFDDGSIVYSQYGHMMETETIKFPMRLSCVEAGQIIGAVGSARPAPHLHFEIKLEGADNPGPGYSWTNPYDEGWRQASKFIVNRQAWSQNWHRWHLQINDPNGFRAPLLLLSDSSLLYIDGLSLRLATYDGRVLWRLVLDRPALAVVEGQDQPLVIYQDGTVVQVDPNSEGAVQDSWQIPDVSFAAAAPIVAGEQLLLRTTDDALVALSADRRSINWRVDGIPLYKDAYVAPELIALLTQNNNLMLLNREGAVISTAPLRGSVGFTTASDNQFVVYGRGGLWKVNGSGEWGLLLNGDTPQVVENSTAVSSAVYLSDTGSVYTFDGSALNVYDTEGIQQWTVPLALSGHVEIAPLDELLLLLSNHGDLAVVQQNGVLCAAGQIYGDSSALLWYSPHAGIAPTDNALRVAVGDQVIGIDWQRFTSACNI